MRVLLDNLTAAVQPQLGEFFTTTEPDSVMDVFNPFLRPLEIANHFRTFQPDIIVVDQAWLLLSAPLITLLVITGCGAARRILAANEVNDVLKVRTAHHGFHEVINTSSPVDQVFTSIKRVSNGSSQLENDPLWNSITRPATLPDISIVPHDVDDMTILELMRIGLPDRDIAKVIHMSHQTVRNRVSAMLERSRLSNHTQMAWMYTNQMLTKTMMENMNKHV